jgi:hypothetical protein
MVINKINTKETEELLMGISEESIKLKILQEELESVSICLKDIDSELRLGKISKKLYREFKYNLETEKKVLESKVKKTTERILLGLKNLYKTVSDCKV